MESAALVSRSSATLVTKEAASMLKLSNVTKALPRMLTGTELTEALQVLPPYDPHIRQQDTATRLTALSDLYRIYLPAPMSSEIYTKLYLALLRSLQKKGTKLLFSRFIRMPEPANNWNTKVSLVVLTASLSLAVQALAKVQLLAELFPSFPLLASSR